MGLFSGKSKERRFWEWFQKNEGVLFDSAEDPSVIMDSLHGELKKVHPVLVWQLSRVDNGQREFVISADGIRAGFDAVEALADAAPQLPRWKVIRFRPREPDYASGSLNMDGPQGRADIKCDEVECALCAQRHKDGTVKIAIELFIRGCPANEPGAYRTAGFLLLDSALGEYDMECKVGFIGMYPFETEAEAGEKIPFARLREEFDALVERTLGPA